MHESDLQREHGCSLLNANRHHNGWRSHESCGILSLGAKKCCITAAELNDLRFCLIAADGFLNLSQCGGLFLNNLGPIACQEAGAGEACILLEESFQWLVLLFWICPLGVTTLVWHHCTEMWWDMICGWPEMDRPPAVRVSIISGTFQIALRLAM